MDDMMIHTTVRTPLEQYGYVESNAAWYVGDKPYAELEEVAAKIKLSHIALKSRLDALYAELEDIRAAEML